MLGDVLHDLFLPPSREEHREIPQSVWSDPNTGGQTYLLSDKTAQETLAPSLLLLYGEVEHTGYFEKMSHRSKIASLIKFLWESSEHRPAFRSITENKVSFIKFANGIMNETNALITTVMQKLPEIRVAQEQIKNPQEWSQLSEEEQSQISSRLEDNEREVKHALPLANRTLQMFSYLNSDPDIRKLFLLPELCARLVGMLQHVLSKLVGARGLELKVDDPDQYEFRPKEMLRDLCSIFALFSASEDFQAECAKAGCDPNLLRDAAKPLRKFNLLTGESIIAFEALPNLITIAAKNVSADDELYADAPEEFTDGLLYTYMTDPVKLPSGHFVDRSTITQHLLNDPTDPFSREPLTVDDIVPATELKAKMDAWLAEKRASRHQG
jgi:ubiquitin conjugation factor E4 B